MHVIGRRIGMRGRTRTGTLSDSDGTLDDAVDPVSPGTDDTATGSTDGSGGISIEVGLLL